LRIDRTVHGDIASREQFDVAAFEPTAGIDRALCAQVALRIQTDVAAAPLGADAPGRQAGGGIDHDVSTRREKDLTAHAIRKCSGRVDDDAAADRQRSKLRVELHVPAQATARPETRTAAAGVEIVEHLENGASIGDDAAATAGIADAGNGDLP
jgi:hypothetical protein